jgi:hypothetical protein
MRAAREKHPFSAHHLYQGFVLAKSSPDSNGGPTFAFVVIHLLFAFILNLQAVGWLRARGNTVPCAPFVDPESSVSCQRIRGIRKRLCNLSDLHKEIVEERLDRGAVAVIEADPIADHAPPAAVRPLDVPHQREACGDRRVDGQWYPDHQSGMQLGSVRTRPAILSAAD